MRRRVNATCFVSTALLTNRSASTVVLPSTPTTVPYRYGDRPTTTWSEWQKSKNFWISEECRHTSSTALGFSSSTRDLSPEEAAAAHQRPPQLTPLSPPNIFPTVVLSMERPISARSVRVLSSTLSVSALSAARYVHTLPTESAAINQTFLSLSHSGF